MSWFQLQIVIYNVHKQTMYLRHVIHFPVEWRKFWDNKKGIGSWQLRLQDTFVVFLKNVPEDWTVCTNISHLIKSETVS